MLREDVAKVVADICHGAADKESSMAVTIFVEAMLLPAKRVVYTKEMLETIIYDKLQNKGIYKNDT